MKRNSAIEFYRCLLMFGICLLHCVHRDARLGEWLEQLLLPCVCGFVFISGWYGVRFAPSKVLKIYGVFLYCIVTMEIMKYVSEGCFSIACLLGGIRNYWFAHAYVLMMLLAPLVDHAIEKVHVRALLPFMFAVYGWGFLARFPIINQFVPKTADLNMYSGLTLLGAYATARILRGCRVDERLPMKMLLVAFLALGVVCSMLHLGFYNSPFAVAFAGCGFLIFKRFNLSRGRVWLWLAQSTFSVYFFHLGSATIGTGFMLTIADKMDILPYRFIALFVGTLVSFLLCIVVDVPRRLLVVVLKTKIGMIGQYVDERYDGLCRRLITNQ